MISILRYSLELKFLGLANGMINVKIKLDILKLFPTYKFMSTLVQMRNKGQFTIPSSMREKLNLNDETVLSVTLLESGALLVIPKKLEVPSILKETAAMAKKRGVTLEEMLT